MVMPMSDVELLRAACCVAGLDKEISDNEKKLIDRLAFKAGVGQASLKAMLDRAVRDQGFYREQFRYISADPEEVVGTLFRIAIADHDLHLNERVILQHFAQTLGMAPERFDQFLTAAEKRLVAAPPTADTAADPPTTA